MANTLITPQTVAKEALMVLSKNAVMGNLVYRDFEGTEAKPGDTITIRKPATFEGKEFPNVSGGIDIQNATETGIPVTMNKLFDVSFALTSKELSLSIDELSDRLIKPAMVALIEKMDAAILGLESSITNRVDSTSAKVDMIRARQYLTTNKAPLTGRAYVYNAEVESDLLATDLFTNASAVGDEGTALREASLGRKFGMDCYVDQNVAVSQDAGAAKAIAFHKNAFALVSRPLATPAGAAKSYVENFDGYAIRVTFGYDMDKKQDICSIDMLCGVAICDSTLAAVVQQPTA